MLICVMGNAGAGKDTLIDLVTANDESIKRLKLITDRPKRPNESKDRYNFVSKEEYDKVLEDSDNQFIESRSFKVADGSIWRYGTLINDFTVAVNPKGVYITTCTPRQFTAYYQALNKDYKWHLHPIVLTMLSPKARLERMLERIEDNYDSVNEVCRRFCADDDPVYEDRMLPMYSYPNNNEIDLDRNVELVLYLTRLLKNMDLYALDRHRLFIKDTKYLVGFYREDFNIDNCNKEDK